MITERKNARAFVKFTKPCPACKSTLPLVVTSQLQKLALPVDKKADKSNVIHKHKPTNMAATAQPTNVRFFQSELMRELQVTLVPEFTGAKSTSTIFLAVRGDIPQSEPCRVKIFFGCSSESILKPFSKRAAFKSAYALSISKLTVRSSNQEHHLSAFICSHGPKKPSLMSRSSLKTSYMPACGDTLSFKILDPSVKLRNLRLRRRLRPWDADRNGRERLVNFKSSSSRLFWWNFTHFLEGNVAFFEVYFLHFPACVKPSLSVNAG